MKHIIVSIALLFCSTVVAVHAEGLNFGVGAAKCANYTAAFSDPDPSAKKLVVAWVQGFVSALNIAAGEGHMRQLSDADVLESKLLLYCKEQPNDLIATAAMRLYKNLSSLK